MSYNQWTSVIYDKDNRFHFYFRLKLFTRVIVALLLCFFVKFLKSGKVMKKKLGTISWHIPITKKNIW